MNIRNIVIRGCAQSGGSAVFRIIPNLEDNLIEGTENTFNEDNFQILDQKKNSDANRLRRTFHLKYTDAADAG